MAVIYVPHFIQFFDDNGDPLAGGKLYTYEAGTSTPKATYTDAGGGTPNANPVVLDAAGRATVFLSGAYKFTLKTSADVLVKETNNITAFSVQSATVDNIIGNFTEDTIVAADSIIFSDASDNNGTKRDTVQGIIDLSNASLASAFKDKILNGLALTINSVDSTNDIDIAAGSCASDDGTTIITLSARTKKLDATWVVGTGEGGLDTGAVGNNTYFIWAIYRPDTGVSDILFSLSSSSPSMPSNYTKKKRIGAVIRVSGANDALFPVNTFTSSLQTITAGGSLAIPHYLGVKPSAVFIELVCSSTEYNYSSGDVIQLQPVDSSGAASGQGVSIQKNDATNINLRYGSAVATFIILDKTSGNVASATNANWRLRVRAIP